MSVTNQTNSVSADMLDLLRREFADVLGDHIHLLDKPGGLDEILTLLKTGQLTRQHQVEDESRSSVQLKRRLSA
mgnify:CR=1 FL=1